MQIDLAASEPHYRTHLLPIFEALPDDVRGKDWGDAMRIPPDRTLLLGGYADVKRHALNRYVYVEHGAGQSYVGMDYGVLPFYSGGHGHNNAIGFICPNDEVASRWVKIYPDTPVAVVGCPRLDPWHSGLRGKQVEDRTVAITFHWDAIFTGVHATASAFGHYYDCLADVIFNWRNQGWTVLGHWHPRYPAVAQFWEQLSGQFGVEVVADADEVLDRASVLVADNTSMQADFLSLGRPVVWLNHPTYRLDDVHGGRFWVWPTLGGQSVSSPEDLRRIDLASLPEVTGHPYAYADGRASQRASSAIRSWISANQIDVSAP